MSKLIPKLIAILLVVTLLVIPNISKATDPISNPGYYNPGGLDADNTLTQKASGIISIFTSIGMIIGVGALIALGIRYMVGSAEQKAEYKKTMIPYVVGFVMVVGISSILKLVISMLQGLNIDVQ